MHALVTYTSVRQVTTHTCVSDVHISTRYVTTHTCVSDVHIRTVRYNTLQQIKRGLESHLTSISRTTFSKLLVSEENERGPPPLLSERNDRCPPPSEVKGTTAAPPSSWVKGTTLPPPSTWVKRTTAAAPLPVLTHAEHWHNCFKSARAHRALHMSTVHQQPKLQHLLTVNTAGRGIIHNNNSKC